MEDKYRGKKPCILRLLRKKEDKGKGNLRETRKENEGKTTL